MRIYDFKYKNILLVDGLGALISALALGIVLPTFNKWIGMPNHILHPLAFFALSYATYSLYCFKFARNQRRKWLSTPIFANPFYCFVTAALVTFYFSSLTTWGLTYFLAEVFLILGLVFFERRICLVNHHFT